MRKPAYAHSVKATTPHATGWRNPVSTPAQSTSLLILLTVAGSGAGCTAPVVEDAASKFHDGYIASTKTMANRQAALINVERFKQSYDLYAAANAAATPDRVLEFAQYVCAEPLGMDDLAAGLATTSQAATIVDTKNLKPDPDFISRIKGLNAAQQDFPGLRPAKVPNCISGTECRAAVVRYTEIRPKELPIPQESARRVFAFAAIPALIGVAQATYQGINLVIGQLEEQARADRLKRFIRDPVTQETMNGAFFQMYGLDPASGNPKDNLTVAFCENSQNASICASSKNNEGNGREATVQPADYQPSAPDAKKKTCAARPDDTYFFPPKSKTILDGVTISERWANLKRSWYAYLDFTIAGISSNREPFERQQLLDQAIADYVATPSVTNVAGDMVQAWSKLTDLSYGCLTDAEAFAALSAFASNANVGGGPEGVGR